jgi:hypothetical protein
VEYLPAIQGIKGRLQNIVIKIVPTMKARCGVIVIANASLCIHHYTHHPKLLFGNDDEESVVRISQRYSTKSTEFATLTERISNIATGPDKGQWCYPIFWVHVGAHRLEVRKAIQQRMCDRFKVVE